MKKLIFLITLLFTMTVFSYSQVTVQTVPFHDDFSSTIDTDVWDTLTLQTLNCDWRINTSDPLTGSYCLELYRTGEWFGGGHARFAIDLTDIEYGDPLVFRYALKNNGLYNYSNPMDCIRIYGDGGGCTDSHIFDGDLSDNSSNWTNSIWDIDDFASESSCIWGHDEVWIEFDLMYHNGNGGLIDNVYVCFDIDDWSLANINGDNEFCVGTGSKTYYVTNPIDADYDVDYQWYYTGSYTGDLDNDQICVFTPITSGTLKVRAVSGWINTDLIEKVITVNTLPTTPNIPTGQATICRPGVFSYETDPVTNADDYTWDITGGTWDWYPPPYGEQTDEEIDIIIQQCGHPSPTCYYIKVKANNECGSSSWSPIKNVNSWCNCQ